MKSTMKTQTDHYMTVAAFCRTMNTPAGMIELIRGRCKLKTRAEQIPFQTNEEGIRTYRDCDMLEILQQIQQQTDKVPAGCMTVREFVRARPEYTDFISGISSKMSHLFSSGSVKRYSSMGKQLNFKYHVADLERVAEDYVKRNGKPRPKKINKPTPRKTYTPGIFVRLWRWLFGYNN